MRSHTRFWLQLTILAFYKWESLETMFTNHMLNNHVLKACLAAVFAIGLTACGSSSDNGSAGTDDTPVAMPEPTPEPTPEPDPGQVDLATTQAAAAAAAAAAMTASDNADASADGAEAATANSATLQTGAMAEMYAMGARESAKEAMAEYMKAKAASEAAAAATTASAAGRALENAEAAQAAAEAAAGMASEKAMKATDAAKMELMIDGTMKMVGDSSIDADMGKLTKTADDGSKTITGHESDVKREKVGAVTGQAHSAPGDTPVEPYKQAVAARNLAIGKTLDTTDDMARVVVIHSRAGSKKVRVYALETEAAGSGDLATFDSDSSPANLQIRTDEDGMSVHSHEATFPASPAAITEDSTKATPVLKSVGMYYEAAPVPGAAGVVDNALDHTDQVGAETKGKEVFSYGHVTAGTDGSLGTADDVTTTRYVIEVSKTVSSTAGTTDVSYRHVDVMAQAAPDGPDADAALDLVGVKAALPSAVKYSHIHFGVWAGLGDAEKDGTQKLADLGIGFVQNIGEGMPEGTGIGTATFNGDWVAVVQRQNSAAAGAFNQYDGGATLTADFNKDEFKGVLTGLATLEGSLSGYAFSGTKATAISHPDLDSSGTFKGSFSGGIYGDDGSEAAGVFSFMGGEAGSFVGAFGGGTSKP